MTIELTKSIKIFCSYARKDKALLSELDGHLAIMKRSGIVTIWSASDIQPGTRWKDEVHKQLEASDIVLLILTPNFLHSDACHTEMLYALEKQKSVIPIIVRSCDWQQTPLADLQVLPAEGKPVMMWRNRDEAFQDVVKGIHEIVTTLLFQKQKDQEQALQQDPDDITVWYELINLLRTLHREDDALNQVEQAIKLNPQKGYLYGLKGYLLYNAFDKTDEALQAYEEAIHCNPQKSSYHVDKGIILCWACQDYEQALKECDEAIRLNPYDDRAYGVKADVFVMLGRGKEGLAALDQAISLDPDPRSIHKHNRDVIGDAFELGHL